MLDAKAPIEEIKELNAFRFGQSLQFCDFHVCSQFVRVLIKMKHVKNDRSISKNYEDNNKVRT